jgi:hypothetical protein
MIRRILRQWPYFLAFATILLVYLAWPGSDTFTVSPETTRATEHVTAEGYVDYVQTVNEKLRQGITPETNANVMIWKVIGPHPEGSNLSEEYFQWLQAPPPPEAGDYFLTWKKFSEDEINKLVFDEAEPQRNAQTVREEWTKHWEAAGEKPWKKEQFPEIARWLELNEKPLALLIRASKFDHYYNPLVSPDNGSYSPRLMLAPLPNVQISRGLVTALCRRALLHAAADDYQLAWKDLLACLRLGRLLSHGGSLIESLVGYACTQQAINSIHGILSDKQQPSARMLTWIRDIQSLPPMKPAAENVDLLERMTILEILTSLIASKSRFQLNSWVKLDGNTTAQNPSTPHFWDSLFTPSVNWDPAFKLINEWVDRSVAIARLDNYPERAEAFEQHNSELKELKRKLINPKSIPRYIKGRTSRGEMYGELLLTLFLPAVEKICIGEERTKQSLSNIQVALALAAYRADKGRYPEKLEALAPKYLASIPQDRFARQPLHYVASADTYLLYSVGPNLIDNNGLGNSDQPRGDDVGLRIPKESPRPLETPAPHIE